VDGNYQANPITPHNVDREPGWDQIYEAEGLFKKQKADALQHHYRVVCTAIDGTKKFIQEVRLFEESKQLLAAMEVREAVQTQTSPFEESKQPHVTTKVHEAVCTEISPSFDAGSYHHDRTTVDCSEASLATSRQLSVAIEGLLPVETVPYERLCDSDHVSRPEEGYHQDCEIQGQALPWETYNHPPLVSQFDQLDFLPVNGVSYPHTSFFAERF
jgi:hypothetical protein